jgi:hypothetical protein
MTQLTTNPVTQVIIFHDSSRKMITEPQANLIFQASAGQNKSITTPQLGMITFSAIAKIISLNDFYEQYPDERPDYRPEWKAEPTEPYKSVQDQIQANEAMRSGVVKGLEQFIRGAESRGETPDNAKWILDHFKNKKKVTLLQNV